MLLALQKKRFTLLVLAAGISMLLLAVAGYIYVRTLATSPSKQTILLHTLADCDPLKVACRAEGAGMELTFQLPQPVRYLQTFELSVDVPAKPPQAIEKLMVEFRMPGMEMGINRFILQRSTREQAQDERTVWRGKALLPVCVTGRKDWQATVNIETASTRYQAQFDFVVAGG